MGEVISIKKIQMEKQYKEFYSQRCSRIDLSLDNVPLRKVRMMRRYEEIGIRLVKVVSS